MMAKTKDKKTKREKLPPPSVAETQSRVKQCAFCKHWYIKPCDEKTKDACANFKFLATRKSDKPAKGKRK